jgi:lipopolysaccharide transport system permease protein
MTGAPSDLETPASRSPLHVTTIEPHHAWWRVPWDELIRYHELLAFFVWRDLKVRYKQTVLGVAWAFLQPIFAMLVFTVFFGRLAKIPTGGIPYPLLAYTGILLWQFFSRSLTEASTSLAANERLLTKVYFPRLYVPLSVILAAIVDLAVAGLIAVPLLAYYGYHPRFAIFLIPFVVFMVIVAALGVGLLFSALDVRYRDLRYVLPFLNQIWMFCSPVVYPSSLVPERWRSLYALNPMVGFIETFRVALLGTGTVPWTLLASSSCSAVALLLVGFFVFQGMERRLTDVV